MADLGTIASHARAKGREERKVHSKRTRSCEIGVGKAKADGTNRPRGGQTKAALVVSAAVSTKISSKDEGSFDVDEFTNKDTASVGHAETRSEKCKRGRSTPSPSDQPT